jgi:hypothetical protein
MSVLPNAAGPLRTLGFAVCVMLLSQPSWAGRPFTTEDADVIAARDCELETFGSHERARPDPSERGGWAQVGCGIGFNTQLTVGAGRFKAGDKSSTVAALIGKTALRPLAEDSFGITLAYALEGIKTSARRLRHTGSSAALVVSIPRGRTIAHANLGIVRDRLESRTRGTYALAVERLGERGVDVGIEVFGEGSESPWIGTGARYAIKPEKLFVDFSFAAQSGGSDARQLTVGLKYAF